MSSAGAFDFSKRLRSINVEIGDAKLFKYAAGLGKITGGFINSTKGNTELIGSLIKSQAFLQNNLGLSEEGAQKFELFSRSMGMNAAASIANITEVAKTFSDATGQDQTQLMSQMVEDISSMGADVATQFGRVPGQLEAATMKARLLGTTMGELSAVGDKLLNIESSIGTEMEYQQLTGHRLLTNSGKSLTNEYRMAQLKGDGVKQAELMKQFLEKEGDTLKNNYIARQKASELFGIDGAKLLEMNAQLKLQKELGVQSLVDAAEGNLKTLEADLRANSNLTTDQIDSVIAGQKAAADVRTPAERSADSLANMEKGIILKGQTAALEERIGTGKLDDAGNEITRLATSKDFVASIDAAIKAGPLAFAETFKETFESTNFIKGVGGLGILSDRLNLAVTPLNQLGDSIPVLGGEIKRFTAEVTRITGFIKDAKNTTTVNPASGAELATGGYISGPGSGTSDSIPARLSDGEYVINASATRRNKSLLDKINSGGPVGYAAGGAVTSTARMESLLSSILVANARKQRNGRHINEREETNIMPTNTTYPNAAEWTPLQAKTTNITLGSLAQKATGFAVGAIGSLSGIPQVAQIGQSFTNSSENYSPKSAYAVSALNAMKSTNNVGIQYPDFRARKFPSKEADTAGASAALSTKRVDGLAVSHKNTI
jgi:hypothetical protein